MSFDESAREYILTLFNKKIVEAAKSLKLKEGTIITYDYGGSEIVDGIKIVYLPFWEWTLT